jgi:nucleotide-binding universal stress UspA family protein
MPEIVVGFDDSPGAQDALAFAATVASNAGASIRLASAFAYDNYQSRTASQAFREYLRADCQAALDRAATTIEGTVPITTEAIPDTSPSHALHVLSEYVGAALVVVGSTHRGPVGRVVPGSTGERLLHGSPCPVAIVPRGYADAGQIRTVGVGYDGSEESQAALAAACQVARRFSASLRVIRVYDATRFGAPALMTIPGEVSYHEDYEKQQREGLDEAVAALPAELNAETVFIAGPPGPELAAQTEHVDLMVVGSRGYGPRAAVLLGGVSHTVIREAHCPVIVLPRGSYGLEPLFSAAAETAAP